MSPAASAIMMWLAPSVGVLVIAFMLVILWFVVRRTDASDTPVRGAAARAQAPTTTLATARFAALAAEGLTRTLVKTPEHELSIRSRWFRSATPQSA